MIKPIPYVKTKFSSLILLSFPILFNFCSNSSETQDGLHVVHFPETEIIQQTIEYKNGKKNGYFKEYYRNGTLKAKQYFKDDEQTDTTFLYHENGKLANCQIKKDKKREGCWTKYNKGGVLYSEICFRNGVFHGQSTEYTYRTGHLLTRLNFDGGRKHGKQETFYNSGKPKSISYFHYDDPCIGTEEWYESGKKIDNDFKISLNEQNQILLKNTLTYIIKLEKPEADDIVYEASTNDTGRVVNYFRRLTKVGDHFTLEFFVPRGGFVMKKIKIAAFRKTRMGNTFIKTLTFNASANHF